MYKHPKILLKNMIRATFAMLFFYGIGLLFVAFTPVAEASPEEDFQLVLDISLGTPTTYVQPNKELTYNLKIENTTDAAYTNLKLYNDLPANTSHVSGGTFVDDTTDYVEFSLSNLAAKTTMTFTWVAKVDSNASAGILITNSSFGFVGGEPANTNVGYGGNVTTLVDKLGTLEAVYKNSSGTAFNVEIDSYQFDNYGNSGPQNVKDDLGADDLFMLFGEGACQSGKTASTCVLSAPAKAWAQKQIEGMSGGHCEGMAASSLRMFDDKAFKTFSSPSTFQTDAKNTVDLNFPKQSIENYIAYYFVTQSVEPEYYFANEITVSSDKSPKDLVDALIDGFNNKDGSVAYTVGIYTEEFKAGHAIAAYGVEKVSNDEYRMLVYDNNFPKQRQYITVKKENNKWGWIYTTAATPGEEALVYTGTDTSGNLSLHYNDSRDLAADDYYKCPFCPEDSSKSASSSIFAVDADIHFQYTGEGAILVTNDEGQSTGANPTTNTFVSEIPNAKVNHFKGGLGKEIPPQIVVPAQETDDTFYTVIVHGETISNTATGSLHITGPGFSIGVNDTELDANETLEFTISPDGDHIAFTASEDLTAPEIYIAHDPVNAGDPSVIFDIEGVTLLANEKVVLELEPEDEQIYFTHTGPEAENFVVDMELIWPDGDIETFAQTINTPAGATSAFVDFGAWDGLGDPPIYIDNVLQNASINERLKLETSIRAYSATPAANAPAGVYSIEATFTNVTEVALKDISFDISDLAAGNVLLNADGGPAGKDGKVSIPAEALGADKVLNANESFTITFEVGLAQAGVSELVIDANGTPHDWEFDVMPAPSYNGNNASFMFDVASTNRIFLPFAMR